MNIVLDTNIILVSVSQHSKYYCIIDKLLKNEFTLCLTSDIINEYEEMLSVFYTNSVKENFLQMILNLNNVKFYEKYYRWNLIYLDPDDNKFVDCAIASNSSYIVTNDKHFRVLNTISFPKVNIIGIDDFIDIFW